MLWKLNEYIYIYIIMYTNKNIMYRVYTLIIQYVSERRNYIILF